MYFTCYCGQLFNLARMEKLPEDLRHHSSAHQEGAENAHVHVQQMEALIQSGMGVKRANAKEQDDRSTLVIPYCARYLHWDVVYNKNHPDIPPDFILEEGQEGAFEIGQVGALLQWTPQRQDALVHILAEMLELFKTYQKQQIREYPSPRLQFEFSTLENIEGIEFWFNKAKWEVYCLVPIPNKLSDDKLSLFLIFDPACDKAPERKLVYESGSSWEALVFGMKLPIWTEDMCTMSYLPSIKDMIQELHSELTARQKLMGALSKIYGSPAEYDGYTYRKIAFTFDFNNLIFVALFSIPSQFPDKRPIVTLSSMIHHKNGKPVQMIYDDYPYSPRWSVDEYAVRIKAYLVHALPDFKKFCVEESFE